MENRAFSKVKEAERKDWYNTTVMKDLIRALRGHTCLVFLDLEGTQVTHEMIEIGAYKVTIRDDLTIKKVFKPYSSYVLAKHRVGPIVTELTGITDFKLKKEGVPFRVVQQGLKKYLGKDYKNALFISYGSQDAKIFLASGENNMDASMEEARYVAHHFFDLAEFVGKYVRDSKGNILSLTNCLKVFNVDFVGTAHSAVADAYNLFLLFKAFVENKDIVQREYKLHLTHVGNCPQPLLLTLRALLNGETVTPERFDEFVKESLK